MNKNKMADIVIATVDDQLPGEVSHLVKDKCLIVIDDLSEWNLIPRRHNTKGKELLGIFGFENDMPVIGLNHKALRTKAEIIKITMHEIAHFYLHYMGLPNGERATNKLAKQWGNIK